MSEATYIKPADLAQHWGLSKGRVSQLTNGTKKMPRFTSLQEADAWRSLNVSARPTRELRRSSLEASQGDGKKRGLPQPQQPPEKTGGTSTGGGGEIVDITPFVNRVGDFETIMVKDAEAMPKIARGLFDRACQKLNVAEIAAFLKIWSDAADKAANARQAFLNIQERTRALIAMDDVEDVLGTELQALRSSMLRLGARCAAKANPADPALAQGIIDAAVDEMWKQLEAGIANGKQQLIEGKVDTEEPEPTTPPEVKEIGQDLAS